MSHDGCPKDIVSPSLCPIGPRGSRVRVEGCGIYLGPHGSPERKQAYARVLAEHCANAAPPSFAMPAGEKLSIAALVVKHTDLTTIYDQKNEALTDDAIKAAVARLIRLYGNTLADEFGSKRLKAIPRPSSTRPGELRSLGLELRSHGQRRGLSPPESRLD